MKWNSLPNDPTPGRSCQKTLVKGNCTRQPCEFIELVNFLVLVLCKLPLWLYSSTIVHLPVCGCAHTTLVWWCAYTTAIVGTSLNEPHTTVTSLHTCLCMRMSCFLGILFTFIFVKTLKHPSTQVQTS